MELDRAIPSMGHGLASRYLGHATGDLRVPAEGIITEQGGGVVAKAAAVFDPAVNVHRGMFQRLIGANQFTELLAGLEVIDNHLKTAGSTTGGLRRRQQGTQQAEVPQGGLHLVSSEHAARHNTAEIHLRCPLGKVDESVARNGTGIQLRRLNNSDRGFTTCVAHNQEGVRLTGAADQVFGAGQNTIRCNLQPGVLGAPIGAVQIGHRRNLARRNVAKQILVTGAARTQQQLSRQGGIDERRAQQGVPHGLDHRHHGTQTQTGATYGFRQGDPGPAKINHLAPEAGLVTLLRFKKFPNFVGGGFVLQKSPGNIHEHALLFAELEGHTAKY